MTAPPSKRVRQPRLGPGSGAARTSFGGVATATGAAWSFDGPHPPRAARTASAASCFMVRRHLTRQGRSPARKLLGRAALARVPPRRTMAKYYLDFGELDSGNSAPK